MRVSVVKAATAIVHKCRVAETRVIEVDVTEIYSAGVIPRTERFAEPQREPTDSSAEAKSKTATEKSHESRPVNRSSIIRTRAPAPTATDKSPAPVMKWRESPRFIANPSPAPRPDVVPISVAIGSPANIDSIGIPDRPVVWFFIPRTVIVEVAVTRHIARHVARRNRIVLPQVAIVGPLIELVGLGCRPDKILHIVVHSVEFAAFSRMNGVSLSIRRDFTFAANRSDARHVTIFIHIDSECAGFGCVESEIRSIDFVDLAFAQFPDAYVDRALRQAHLRRLIVHIQK